MAKKKQSPRPVRRGGSKKKSPKRPQPKPVFGFTFNVGYNKPAGVLKVQMCLTGGRWIGRSVRTIGNVLRSRVLASGAAATLAAALAWMAS